MIDFTENEDGSITYQSADGRVVGHRVGILAVRTEPENMPFKLWCGHCNRDIAPLRKVYVVDNLRTGARAVPARSWDSAMVFADSMSLQGMEMTDECEAWLCEQDLREVRTGETFTPLRQWRRERDEASNFDPKMRL